MNNKQKKVVKGLANIGALLDRAEIPTQPPAPSRERRDLNGLFNHTREKVHAALPFALDKSHTELVKTYINAGLREAYNLGHAEALEQNSSVEKLLVEQYRVRTEVTMPAVVCGIMEQSGLESMTLDMARMATVFDRLDVDYTYDQDTEIMSYTVRPAGAIKHAAQTRLDEEVRHQVEDIEQTAREDLWCGTLDTPTTSEHEGDQE